MSLFGDVAGLFGAGKKEDAQYAASQKALGLQQAAFDQAKQNFSPYLQYSGAANKISRLFGLDGQPADMSAFTASPGYQFRLDQGTNALEKSAAARGGLFSGATGKALTDYGQNAASQEFDNYLNRLFGISGMGQQAASGISNAGQQYADAAGNINLGIGENQGKRIMSQSNAIGSLANQGAAAVMGGFGGGDGFSGSSALKALFGM